MARVSLIASVALIGAAALGLNIGVASSAAAQDLEKPIERYQRVYIRRYLGPQYVVGLPYNKTANETVYALRRSADRYNAPEVEMIRKYGRLEMWPAEPNQYATFFKSGDNVYLVLDLPGSDYIKFAADTENNPTLVLSNEWIRAPQTDVERRFFIEKSGGSPGPEIRLFDPFYIRGIRGNGWLTLEGCSGMYVCMRQNRTEDDQWVFEPSPPEESAPLPPAQPPISSPPAQPSSEPATGCVEQTLVGPTNVWKYKNTCGRAVRATVRRTCHSLQSNNEYRDVVITVEGGADYDFNRPLMFGSFCEPPYNTLTEGVVSQVYR